jgi:glutamate synthase (NADPH/NADH) small chain
MTTKTTTKLNLNRVAMPKQSPLIRGLNFQEVAQGYAEEQAKAEASRCLQCPKRPCVEGCPVGVDIPGFIKEVQKGDLAEAVKILKAKNSLPAICGRVCPQETQCEEKCSLAKKGAPIAIGRLERYVADWELADVMQRRPQLIAPIPSGKSVAIIGAGPAGLTAAADLAKLGHRVVIFEALHVAGGVLVYGIPEFRLPKDIVQAEVEYVKSLGVELALNCVVGKTLSVDELLQDVFQAIFLGTGAGLPMFLNIPGENLSGIYSANEFLTRVNLMKAYLFPDHLTPVNVGERVVVIGGGNVAMDSARCALRLGAYEVHVVYRRSRAEMPARREEVENAEEEGVIFQFLTNPKRFIGNPQGAVTGMECVEMELGEPDASGRPRPIPKPGSDHVIETDTVIVALGTTPNPLIPATTKGLETTGKGIVVADKETGLTTRPAVWAGGDLTTGSATVISAMGAGKRAAASIHAYLINGITCSKTGEAGA